MSLQKKNLIIFAAILFLAVLFWSSFTAQKALGSVLTASDDFIKNYPVVSALLFLFLGALSAMFAFLSSVALVPIAIFSWGKEFTFFLLFGGWLLGGVLAYLVGKHLGRPFVKRIFSPAKISFYEDKISPVLNFPLVFIFRLALPAEVPGYILGILRYSFGKYFGATALAELPFAVGAVSAGQSFLEKNTLVFGILIVLGFMLITSALYLFRRRTKNNIK